MKGSLQYLRFSLIEYITGMVYNSVKAPTLAEWCTNFFQFAVSETSREGAIDCTGQLQ